MVREGLSEEVTFKLIPLLEEAAVVLGSVGRVCPAEEATSADLKW